MSFDPSKFPTLNALAKSDEVQATILALADLKDCIAALDENTVSALLLELQLRTRASADATLAAIDAKDNAAIGLNASDFVALNEFSGMANMFGKLTKTSASNIRTSWTDEERAGIAVGLKNTVDSREASTIEVFRVLESMVSASVKLKNAKAAVEV